MTDHARLRSAGLLTYRCLAIAVPGEPDRLAEQRRAWLPDYVQHLQDQFTRYVEGDPTEWQLTLQPESGAPATEGWAAWLTRLNGRDPRSVCCRGVLFENQAASRRSRFEVAALSDTLCIQSADEVELAEPAELPALDLASLGPWLDRLHDLVPVAPTATAPDDTVLGLVKVLRLDLGGDPVAEGSLAALVADWRGWCLGNMGLRSCNAAGWQLAQGVTYPVDGRLPESAWVVIAPSDDAVELFLRDQLANWIAYHTKGLWLERQGLDRASRAFDSLHPVHSLLARQAGATRLLVPQLVQAARDTHRAALYAQMAEVNLLNLGQSCRRWAAETSPATPALSDAVLDVAALRLSAAVATLATKSEAAATELAGCRAAVDLLSLASATRNNEFQLALTVLFGLLACTGFVQAFSQLGGLVDLSYRLGLLICSGLLTSALIWALWPGHKPGLGPRAWPLATGLPVAAVLVAVLFGAGPVASEPSTVRNTFVAGCLAGLFLAAMLSWLVWQIKATQTASHTGDPSADQPASV